MIPEIASSTLATIAYRIATEPAFVHQLRSLVETRLMANGQVITEAEAAALKSVLEFGVTSLTSMQLDGALGALVTWMG